MHADVAAINAGTDGWKHECALHDGGEVVSRTMPGISLRKFCAKGVIKATPEEVGQALGVPSERMKWDTSAAIMEIVEEVAAPEEGAKSYITHMATHRVLTISGRDFVSVQVIQSAKGCVFSAACSTVDDRRPSTSKFVRGEVLPGCAWYCEPAPQADGSVWCTLYYIVLTDIKGWVPAALVNAGISENFQSYFKGLRKHFPPKQ